MYRRYYVNTNVQPNGDHEVHHQDCLFLPGANNHEYLGAYNNCQDAVRESRKRYRQTNGCYHCCGACHTG